MDVRSRVQQSERVQEECKQLRLTFHRSTGANSGDEDVSRVSRHHESSGCKPSANKRRVEGPASESYEEGISILQQTFSSRNISFYLKPLQDECMERMKNNVSDWAKNQLSNVRNLTYHTVPVPLLPTQVEILTCYNLTGLTSCVKKSISLPPQS